MSAKESISFAIIGHLNSGKSLLSCLLKDGSVNRFFETEDKFETHQKYKQQTLSRYFSVELKNILFQMFDCKSYPKYYKGFFKTISQVDGCFMTVSALDEEFKVNKNSIRDQILLSKIFEIEKFVFFITKMDHEKVKYSEEVFNSTVKKLRLILDSLELKSENYKFIPISALEKENIFETQTTMKWWSGETVFDILGKMLPPKRVQYGNITRFSIRESLRIGGIGTVVIGCVLQGSVSLKGYGTYSVKPIRSNASILTIEKGDSSVDKAEMGDFVGLTIRYASNLDFQSGYALGDLTLQACEKIQVKLKIQDYPTHIHPGYEPILFVHCANSRVKIDKILFTFNDQTNDIIEKNPSKIKSGDFALVELIPFKQICVEEFDLCAKMGKISILPSKISK
eukprot:gene3962-7218_t